MLTKSQVRAILDKTEALQDGHFALPSHVHSAQLVAPMRVLQQPEYATSLGQTLGAAYRSLRPQCVVAREGVSALLGLELARALRVRLVVAERHEHGYEVSLGQRLTNGERVVLCYDLVDDETAIADLARLVTAAGAQVVAVGTLADRTHAAWPHAWPLESLVRIETPLLAAARCPQCQAGEPLTHLDSHAVLQA